MNELARDIEKLLDKAFPGLPVEARGTEVCFHLTAALPDKISLQLKLLPRMTYDQTIEKAHELHLIFRRNAEQVSHVDASDLRDWHIDRLEEAISQVSAQLASLGTCSDVAISSWCFQCGRPAHLAQNCRSAPSWDIVCL